MHSIKPYLIVPTLIEQPTWGGDYITTLKHLQIPSLANKKIGQSYELWAHTKFSLHPNSFPVPIVQLALPTDPDHPQLIGDQAKTVDASAVVATNPQAWLGSDIVTNQNSSLDILIKLTQAKGNSYQLHVTSPTGKWLPKPESWYYLKPGLVTLGVKPNIDWDQYQQVCNQISQLSESLSLQVKAGQLPLDQAKQNLQEFISTHNPANFVNTLSVKSGQTIDLSPCGIHHSWEENEITHPDGNVLYEVQKNVYDNDATIRNFDKGKINSDGSLRPIHIDDYFKYIDRSAKANNPTTHFTDKKILEKTSTYTIRQLFDTSHYRLQQLSFNQPILNKFTTTTTSYHHLWASKSGFTLIWQDLEYHVSEGFSIFIPAACGQYQLKPYKSNNVSVLKTYL